MCCRVLPMWENIASPEQAQILTLLTELCMFTAQISNPLMAAGNVYKLLLVRKKKKILCRDSFAHRKVSDCAMNRICAVQVHPLVVLWAVGTFWLYNS